MIVSGFRAALDLDTYPLSNLISPRALNGLNLVEVQQLPCYKGKKINLVILLKRLRSRDMA